MPTYRNSYNGAERTTADVLGYPWIEIESPEGEPVEEQEELAVMTADAILAVVGTDPDLAQEALDEENEREAPRTSLVAKLERIVRNG